MFKNEKWHYLGNIGVDSGTMMLSDPSYVSSYEKVSDDAFMEALSKPDPKINPYSSVGTLHQTLGANQFGGVLVNDIGAELGAVCSTGIGDGVYPVFIKTAELEDWGTRVIEMKIVFIDEDER